jgi:hypothetical protein
LKSHEHGNTTIWMVVYCAMFMDSWSSAKRNRLRSKMTVRVIAEFISKWLTLRTRLKVLKKQQTVLRPWQMAI